MIGVGEIVKYVLPKSGKSRPAIIIAAHGPFTATLRVFALPEDIAELPDGREIIRAVELGGIPGRWHR